MSALIAADDLGWVRGLLTLALFAAFIVLVVRTWQRDKKDWDPIARMPLDDDSRKGGA